MKKNIKDKLQRKKYIIHWISVIKKEYGYSQFRYDYKNANVPEDYYDYDSFVEILILEAFLKYLRCGKLPNVFYNKQEAIIRVYNIIKKHKKYTYW